MLFVEISKMVQFHFFTLFVIFITTSANAAPSQSEINKLEEIAKINTADIKLDEPVSLEDTTKDNQNDSQGQRQKRFYDYNGYGFPPISPGFYPNFPSNGPFQSNYGEDPLQHIYRRLQDIASVVRTPNFNQHPPPPQFPILFPVIFIPQPICQTPPGQIPYTPEKNTPKPDKNGTDIDIANRFPEMEDTNQNWGIAVDQNETESDDGMEEDFTRPISFEPIKPIRPMNRPPPAVEHGSNQEGRGDSITTTTTAVPPAAPGSSMNAPVRPTICDGAILSCCHQALATYDCFVAQGCPDPTSYGNPCDSKVILQVIDRFARFYGQRSG